MSAPRAYYNEHDRYAAQWIRNLIAAGLVSPGDVDERDIRDVVPSDLAGYNRCHFFAGIAVWDYALGLAGWPADRPVWTGSCPCQPFSAAGQGAGFADERHLWPAFFHLIRECRPAIVFGEQVASKDGLNWLDLVQADLEGEGYAVGAADLCAAGLGAPHIRQRLWFVADAGGQRCDGEPAQLRRAGPIRRDATDHTEAAGSGASDVMANANRAGRHGWPRDGAIGRGSAQPADCGVLGDAESGQQRRVREPDQGERRQVPSGRPGPWSDVEWLACRDGKARPTQPGIHPLAHGATSRVGRLRGYGNAINPYPASAFIGSFLDVEATPTTPQRGREAL